MTWEEIKERESKIYRDITLYYFGNDLIIHYEFDDGHIESDLNEDEIKEVNEHLAKYPAGSKDVKYFLCDDRFFYADPFESKYFDDDIYVEWGRSIYKSAVYKRNLFVGYRIKEQTDREFVRIPATFNDIESSGNTIYWVCMSKDEPAWNYKSRRVILVDNKGDSKPWKVIVSHIAVNEYLHPNCYCGWRLESVMSFETKELALAWCKENPIDPCGEPVPSDIPIGDHNLYAMKLLPRKVKKIRRKKQDKAVEVK